MFRLLYRSKQRGFLELDLVLGKWVEDNIHSMNEIGIKSLVYVLDQVNSSFLVTFLPIVENFQYCCSKMLLHLGRYAHLFLLHMVGKLLEKRCM